MGKIAEYLGKWGFVIFLSLLGISLLFALGCSIYTAIFYPTLGVIGSLGVGVCLLIIVVWLIVEVNWKDKIEENEY